MYLSEAVALLFKKNNSSFLSFTKTTFWPVSVYKIYELGLKQLLADRIDCAFAKMPWLIF